MSLMVNNKYIDMAGIAWRFTQGEKNSDVYEICAPRYDESGTDLFALSWSMVGSHTDYGTLVTSAVSVSEDKESGSVVFAWKVSSDFTACDGVLDLCLQGSDSSGSVVIKYRSSGVRVTPTQSGNLNAPQSVIEQVLSQIALALPQCAAAIEAAKTATAKADVAVGASNTATQKAKGAAASEKNAATSATAAKASETTAAQKSTAAAASATAAANSSTLAVTNAAEAAASSTAAQGYKTQTQQLRDEVHTIVAGNEAYTKKETRDKFSRALEVESPASAAQVIAIDPQSDLRPRYYGFTEQAGAGDPSPTNIRPITVGGNAANLIPFPYADGMSKTTNGVTFTVQNDGGIKAAGAATGKANFIFTRNMIAYADTYLSGAIESTCNIQLIVDGKYFFDTGSGVKVPKGTILSFLLQVEQGHTINTTIYPMLNAGDFAYPYVPYQMNPYDCGAIVTNQSSNLLPNKANTTTLNGVTFTVNADKSVTCTGTALAYGSEFPLCARESPLPSGTYMISTNCEWFNYDTGAIRCKINKEPSIYAYKAPVKVISDGITKIYFTIVILANKTTNFTVYPMLNVGTTALPYEPYIPPINYALPSPVELPDGCSVKAGYVDADKMIQFDGSETVSPYSVTTNGTFALTLLKKKGFTGKSNILPTLNLNPGILSARGMVVNSGNYIYVNFFGRASTVEESRTEIIRLASAGTPLTLYYQSTSYAGEKMPVWLVSVTKKKVVLDGAENWGYISNPAFSRYYLASVQTKENSLLVCDRLAYYTGAENSIAVGSSNTTMSVFLSKESYPTVDSWKTHLALNPTTVIYELPTPETYAIPYTRCESPDTVNCTISTPEGTCSAQYNADLKTYIDRLQSAIIALGGTI